ncbi:hypothetical protein PPACK8108_LOCUS11481 [Phakopsora pachyrhizi]|uniref:FAD/NAD(P)-binding domain-containing protein n=1 Tax=Phakopsora pachyrhizi TaxID=170000 RepID=A0AAV0B3H0_PHAPC|nr:hypothetical protein PPACK8108_LOCUS11481 [Phakopsora pachyrhizi]
MALRYEISRFKTSSGSTKYIINKSKEGQFDGLILVIGTCRAPQKVDFKGWSIFKGQFLHSSELEKIDWTKNGNQLSLVCIGGGASGVEVIETVLDCLDSKPVLVTRNDKWFIPRNFFLSTLLALNLAGHRTWLDWICKKLIEKFHYGRGLKFMVPNQAIQSKAVKEPSGLFDQIPIVNDIFLKLVEDCKVEYVQAEIVQIHENRVAIRARDTSKSSKTQIIPADIIVEARDQVSIYSYTDIGLQTILKFALSHDPLSVSFKDQKCMIPESIYLCGDLSTTGVFLTYQPKDLNAAFRDFETAAQLGYHLAWFRIGREYEVCALGAYEHGENLGECACTYRLGMCYLLGQVNLQVDLRRAVGHLKAAAHLADEIMPQPAYIYGMLLLAYNFFFFF